MRDLPDGRGDDLRSGAAVRAVPENLERGGGHVRQRIGRCP